MHKDKSKTKVVNDENILIINSPFSPFPKIIILKNTKLNS